MSVLIGIAANTSLAGGQPVVTQDFLDPEVQSARCSKMASRAGDPAITLSSNSGDWLPTLSGWWPVAATVPGWQSRHGTAWQATK
jgi:hypothetical protein